MIQGWLGVGRWLAEGVMELICPSRCVVCSGDLPEASEVLCGGCWQRMGDTLQGAACPTCGHNIGAYALIDGKCHRCQKRRPVVSHVVRVGEYEGVTRELVLSFKFRRQCRLDRFLGEMLASAILGKGRLHDADILMPIPLHWRRRWQRTYNQADLLARQTARSLKRHGLRIPVRTDLVRMRYTLPQSTLPASQKLQNLRGAFAVRGGANLAGKHVCLIDDITATGATLRVAAQALKQAGAAKVSAAVFAAAGND